MPPPYDHLPLCSGVVHFRYGFFLQEASFDYRPGCVRAPPLGTHNPRLPSMKASTSLWCNWFCPRLVASWGQVLGSCILEFSS